MNFFFNINLAVCFLRFVEFDQNTVALKPRRGAPPYLSGRDEPLNKVSFYGKQLCDRVSFSDKIYGTSIKIDKKITHQCLHSIPRSLQRKFVVAQEHQFDCIKCCCCCCNWDVVLKGQRHVTVNKPVISMIYIISHTWPLCSAQILVDGVNPR